MNIDSCPVDLEINFVNDFENYIRQNLTVNGFRPVPDDAAELYIHYCNVLSRRIVQHKRSIQKLTAFECPKKFRKGLKLLEKAILRGENLLPWQSKNIMNTGYHDRLFNEHGIHHLHLGEAKEDDSGFMARTGSLLYCMVDSKNFYFIQVLEHGEEHADELVAIIKQDWPKLWAQHKNDKLISAKFNAASEADRIRALLANYENFVKQNAEAFARQVKRLTHAEPAILEFHLHIVHKTGMAYAEESHSKIQFKLGVI